MHAREQGSHLGQGLVERPALGLLGVRGLHELLKLARGKQAFGEGLDAACGAKRSGVSGACRLRSLPRFFSQLFLPSVGFLCLKRRQIIRRGGQICLFAHKFLISHVELTYVR